MKIIATLSFLALGLIGASAATPSLRFAKRNSPNGCADGVPSQAAIAGAINQWNSDVTTVNDFLDVATSLQGLHLQLPRTRMVLQRGIALLVVTGLLLSLMNECTGILAPTFFLILETRRKTPTLQNYEAIIKKSVFLNKADVRWRTSFVLLTLLPLGLSVAYKKLIGERSTIEIQSQFPRYYGLVPPPLGTFNVMNNSIYYMINASVPYMVVSSSARSTPQFPAVYGFNTILLDNTSTALLDLPSPDFLTSIQQNLTDGDSWSISAAVDEIIARYNASTSSYRDNDAF
ncbi:uncharacterized protein Z519_09233 [Cladophialophora bantiana CBS 173.52]|uniref:Uncharacterized protein n=1 Tax=Cladophialophora bantiana (strain ATCC 10958 / CBS 173.52 / CDC B-1940 / NIH 8579) TaxID=1442370 RepID=A0A0D2HYX6_CLAB1|nr:uncharacterized protein Z519_09233 [Cladophialophora bantiana CBS 173.52]KIW89804.1 hypothetical protein Z519_09233 [Cladophialophora bantiana CBS 173.52]